MSASVWRLVKGGANAKRGREGAAQGIRKDRRENIELAAKISSISPEQRHTAKERMEGGSRHVGEKTAHVITCPT